MPSQCCPRRKALLWCLAAAALLLAVCSKSSPLYPLNDWMDANIFYTAGKAMMNGQVLYRDVFDHKGPLLYLVYGVGWLLHRTGFWGVWGIEVLAFAAFLYAGLRTAELFAGPLHPAWVLVPGAAAASGATFAHGGSAEELCLPLLGAALYAVLRFFAARPDRRRPLPLRQAALLGAAAGCVLWVKFTMLGLFAGLALALAAGYLRAGWGGRLLQSIAAFLAGLAATLLPWLVYFGANGALGDFFGVYFGDNLFLYAGQTSGFAPGAAAFAVVQRLWWACHDAPLPALLAAAGFVWLAVRRRGCALAAAAMAACLAVTAFAFGDYHIYYALPLSVFAPLGLVPLAGLARRLPALPARLRRVLPGAGAVLAVGFCLLASPNADQLLRPAQQLPQYRFAADIRADGGGTLLNYGTLDGGFYTVAGQLPPCKYFCVTNLPLAEQQQQQDALLAAGGVDYVVTLDAGLDSRFANCTPMDAMTYDGGEGPVTWYLYRVTA